MSYQFFGAGKGGGGSFTQKPDTLRSNDTFEGLIGLCAGPIVGPTKGLKSITIDGTPLLDESGNNNFNDFIAVVADGDPGKFPQVAQMQLGAGSSPIPVNVSLVNQGDGSSPGPFVTKTIPNTGADAIDLRFIVTQLYRQDKNGVYEAAAHLHVQLKPVGSTQWIDFLINPGSAPTPSIDVKQATYKIFTGQQAFQADGTGYLSISGKTTSPYVQELRIAVPNKDAYANVGWDVRVRLIERDTLDADPNFEKRTISWESAAAVYRDPLGEDEAWRGLAWLHVIGKASDQLTGVPTIQGEYDTKIVSVPPSTVYDPVARTYTNAIWDGTYAKAFTSDPAWIINDACADGISGLSALAPGSYLNKWDALEASKWFSQLVPDGAGGFEPRLSLNLVADQVQKASDFIPYMAGAVGGLAWEDGDGQWRLKVDKPETPTDVFTLENIEGEFAYSHTDMDSRFNDITFVFLNKEFGYREDRVRVFNQPHIDKYGRKPTTIVGIGCTGRQEALRRAMIRLCASINETRMVTFTTNRRGRLLERLNTVLIADGDLGVLPASDGPANRTTGRIVFTNTDRNVITVRDPVRLEVGVNYLLHVTIPNPDYDPEPTSEPGSATWDSPTITITRTITNPANARGDVVQLALDTGLPTTTPEFAVIAIEADGLPVLPETYRILDIKPGDNPEMVVLTAINVDTGKYDASDNVSEAAINAQVPSLIVSPPLIPDDLTVLRLVKIPGEQLDHINLVVNWMRPPSLFIAGFQVRYRVNNGPLMTGIDRTQDTTFELVDPPAGLYQFEIRTIDRRGVVSDPLIASMDVTAALLGDLALQNHVDWGSQITGTGKPEDGATRNVYRGTWMPGQSYLKGDVFEYLGSSYSALVDHIADAGSPPPNPFVTLVAAKGDPGEAGVGEPGPPGNPGASLFTWFAYADAPDGTVNFTTGAPGGRAYQGIAANKTTATESTNPADYVWGFYKGPASFGLNIRGQCVAGPDYILKNGGAAAWDSDAYSTEAYVGGCRTSFVAGQTNASIMIGLNSDPTTDQSYISLDYAWSFQSDATCVIRESGTFVQSCGAYTSTNVFSIIYDGLSVCYLIDGAIKRRIYVGPGKALYLDSSFADPGGRINSLVYAPVAPAIIPASNFNMINRNGMLIMGNSIVKISGTSDWDSSAVSAIGYFDGALVSFVAAQTNMQLMVGLNSDPLTNNGWDNIDYAIYCDSYGSLHIAESGTLIDPGLSYADSDVLSVAYQDGLVVYKKNNTIIRTIAAPNVTYYVDTSLYDPQCKIDNLSFTKLGKAGSPGGSALTIIPVGATATSGGTSIDVQSLANNWVTNGAYTSQMLSGGCILTFKAPGTYGFNENSFFGIDGNPSAAIDYSVIDFAFRHFYDSGSNRFLVEVWESGTFLGQWGWNGNFTYQIRYDSSTGKVTYTYYDPGSGTTVTLRVSNTSPYRTFGLMMTAASAASRRDIMFAGAGGPGRDAVVFQQDATPVAPITGDTWVTTSSPKVWRQWNGSAWIQLLGNIAGYDQVSAGQMAVGQLSAITATIGTLRTAVSGQRTEISDNVLKVFDASNVKRVQIGDLSL